MQFVGDFAVNAGGMWFIDRDVKIGFIEGCWGTIC